MIVIRLLALRSELINSRDAKGHASLHNAAFLGHADIVSHLIQHGAGKLLLLSFPFHLQVIFTLFSLL